MHWASCISALAVTSVIATPSRTRHIARQDDGTELSITDEELEITNDVDGNITTWANFWGWTDCSDGQKDAVKRGLAEANRVLQTPGVSQIDKHWNDYATVEYLGSPWYHKEQHGRELIKTSLDKARTYRQHWYQAADTDIICRADGHDDCKNEASFIAVNNDLKGNEGIALSFCQRYFSMGTLLHIYQEASQGGQKHDLSQYDNRGRAWITAIMRIKWIAGLTAPTVTFPGYSDGKAESASQAKYVAKNYPVTDPAKYAIRNPSSYAWYAMAQWVRKKSGNYPHQPQTPVDLAPAWQ